MVDGRLKIGRKLQEQRNMASISELEPLFRFFMRFYRGQRYSHTPNTPLIKPLPDCNIALITTAGFYINGQQPYGNGDCSYREIPNTIQTHELKIGHKSVAYDKTDTKTDANLVFPLDRFRELESEGKIGSLNHRHFSFMGSISKPKRLITETAPEVAQMLRSDGVDVAFITPV